MQAIRIFCMGTRRGAGIWAVLISLSEIVLNKGISRGLNMTSQRNKKQEHKNEKLHGSHWIMDPTTGGVGAKYGLWTLDSGLDSGLDSWTGLWTEIWTGFWTDTQFNDDHFQP